MRPQSALNAPFPQRREPFDKFLQRLRQFVLGCDDPCPLTDDRIPPQRSPAGRARQSRDRILDQMQKNRRRQILRKQPGLPFPKPDAVRPQRREPSRQLRPLVRTERIALRGCLIEPRACILQSLDPEHAELLQRACGYLRQKQHILAPECLPVAGRKIGAGRTVRLQPVGRLSGRPRQRLARVL